MHVSGEVANGNQDASGASARVKAAEETMFDELSIPRSDTFKNRHLHDTRHIVSG